MDDRAERGTYCERGAFFLENYKLVNVDGVGTVVGKEKHGCTYDLSQVLGRPRLNSDLGDLAATCEEVSDAVFVHGAPYTTISIVERYTSCVGGTELTIFEQLGMTIFTKLRYSLDGFGDL